MGEVQKPSNSAPEGLLLCSQEPSTGPYSEPDRSSPYHPILPKIHFNIIHNTNQYKIQPK
jgi:hypothetical protein